MLDLVKAATLARSLSNSIGTFDKLLGDLNTLFDDQVGNPAPPPPDLAYQIAPDRGALVAISQRTGQVQRAIAYTDLLDKVSSDDAERIRSLSPHIGQCAREWAAMRDDTPPATAKHRAQWEAQRKKIAKDMAGPMSEMLDLIEHIGLPLDDHHHVARHVARSLRDT